ncbi:MAG TPA: hypothetical protein PLR47_06795, partial [Smithellaceae bacterium]|nr:hypothetical protein [Smithellaceae bacterium]
MAQTGNCRNKNENDENTVWGMAVLRPFALIGRNVLSWVDNLGAAAIFLGMALWQIFRRKQFAKTVRQVYYIGARSITIIMLVSLF